MGKDTERKEVVSPRWEEEVGVTFWGGGGGDLPGGGGGGKGRTNKGNCSHKVKVVVEYLAKEKRGKP